MISFLSSPKAFIGRTAILQTAAVRSWLAVGVEIEVILYGDSHGTATACRELDIRHVPDIQTTERGIPYFGAIVDHANRHARYDIQVYINCDILLTPHILTAINCIQFSYFLMIGQRIDLSEGIEINTNNPEIITQLKSLARAYCISLHTPGGSDYFAFRRGMWHNLPPVVIGRGGYDNALIAFCLKRNIPVIDTTLAVIALHQFHDYGHVNGGLKEVFAGGDAKRNLAFVPSDAIPVLEDADYLLRNKELSPNKCRKDLLRFLFMKYRYKKIPFIPDIFRMLWRFQTKIRMIRRWEPTLEEVLSAYEDNQY